MFVQRTVIPFLSVSLWVGSFQHPCRSHFYSLALLCAWGWPWRLHPQGALLFLWESQGKSLEQSMWHLGPICSFSVLQSCLSAAVHFLSHCIPSLCLSSSWALETPFPPCVSAAPRLVMLLGPAHPSLACSLPTPV